MSDKMLFKDMHSLGSSLSRLLHIFLVVRVAADDRAEPAAQSRQDLAAGKGHPSED